MASEFQLDRASRDSVSPRPRAFDTHPRAARRSSRSSTLKSRPPDLSVHEDQVREEVDDDSRPKDIAHPADTVLVGTLWKLRCEALKLVKEALWAFDPCARVVDRSWNDRLRLRVAGPVISGALPLIENLVNASACGLDDSIHVSRVNFSELTVDLNHGPVPAGWGLRNIHDSMLVLGPGEGPSAPRQVGVDRTKRSDWIEATGALGRPPRSHEGREAIRPRLAVSFRGDAFGSTREVDRCPTSRADQADSGRLAGLAAEAFVAVPQGGGSCIHLGTQTRPRSQGENLLARGAARYLVLTFGGVRGDHGTRGGT